ncbi:15937_t:CDS:2 [Rhizophagus irregularis]|nr:15937_t:CDS:2 [Rhizophagus irregularis]
MTAHSALFLITSSTDAITTKNGIDEIKEVTSIQTKQLNPSGRNGLEQKMLIKFMGEARVMSKIILASTQR